MDRRAGLVLGGLALAGALALRVVSRRRPAPLPEPVPLPDPRAEELRRRLAESRELLGERDEFEAAETPVDAAGPMTATTEAADDVDERRREIHERGRTVAEEMRGSSESG